jgi:peptidoglycan/LPS O-acetylase OafA/YrhL
MIQRIQSVWLFLAGVAGLLTYKLPIWTGILQDGSLKNFLGNENLLYFAANIATVLLAFVAIFLFKNRPLQKNMAWLGFLLSIVLIALEVYIANSYETELNLQQSSWKFGAIMPLLMIIFFFLAVQGIRKDEKLIKSLDRLR